MPLRRRRGGPRAPLRRRDAIHSSRPLALNFQSLAFPRTRRKKISTSSGSAPHVAFLQRSKPAPDRDGALLTAFQRPTTLARLASSFTNRLRHCRTDDGRADPTRLWIYLVSIFPATHGFSANIDRRESVVLALLEHSNYSQVQRRTAVFAIASSRRLTSPVSQSGHESGGQPPATTHPHPHLGAPRRLCYPGPELCGLHLWPVAPWRRRERWRAPWPSPILHCPRRPPSRTPT